MAEWKITSLPESQTEPTIKANGNWKITSCPETNQNHEEQFESPPREGLTNYALRTGSRLVARAAESIAGLPGDIAEGATGILNLGNKLGTNIVNKFREEENQIPQTETQNRLPLPTSEIVREKATKKLTGQYLEPRGSGEEFLDSVISDLIPLLAPVKGKVPFKKAIASSTLGNLASWGAKEIGAPESGQAAAKIGTMFLSSLGGVPKLKNHMKELYDNARKSIPGSSTVPANTLEPILNKFQKISESGISTPSKESIKKIGKEIKSKIKSGNIHLSDVWQIKQDLNELAYSSKNLKGVEKLIPELGNKVNSLLEKSGTKYPEFLSNMRQADNIYKGINDASALKSFLNKHVSVEKLISPITGVALGFYPHKTIGTLASLFGAKAAVNFAEPIIKSKVVRNLYKKIAEDALRGNAVSAARNVHKLDSHFAKEFPIND